MSELEESFANLLGRQPSDAERQNLYRIRDALGLKNNDALWLVLIALQYHQILYEKFPDVIVRAANEVFGKFKATADATAKASTEAAKADLAKVVEASAREVAHHVAGRQKAQWIAASAVIVALCLGGVFWYAHSSAYQAGLSRGYGVGYNEAKDEKAAAAWANTPDGNEAYRLAQAGSIGKLSRCDQPGWYIEKGVCYVRVAPNGSIYGWRLP